MKKEVAMFMNDNFGKTVDILQRTMDVSVLRRSVISNNIANAETPNFKRSTVNFESQLKRVLEADKTKIEPEALVTDPRHIRFNAPQNYQDIMPRRVLDYLYTSKNNGNNVDIEHAAMEAQQNQMSYNLMAQAVSNEFATLNLILMR